MNNAFSFHDLGQAVMAVIAGTHPLGPISVTINQKNILSVAVSVDPGGEIREITISARRANVSKDKDPQWILLSAEGHMSFDDEAVVCRQQGRGNYYFTFKHKSRKLHPAQVVAAHRDRLAAGMETCIRKAA